MSTKKMTHFLRDKIAHSAVGNLFTNLNSVDHVVKFQKHFGIHANSKHNRVTTEATDSSEMSPKNSHQHKINGTCKTNNTNKKLPVKTAILTHDQSSIGSYLWYYFFRSMSSLANEKFTTLLFAYLFWNSDNLIARQLIIAWFFVLFTGQLLKDILRMPRPASPPVVVFESNYANEYGMPSTHAMVGTSLPMVMSFLLAKQFQIPLMPMLLTSVVWSIPICLSRLYLGMHTILEILNGLLLTIVILTFVLPMLDFLDFFMLTCSYWIPISVFITTSLAYMYPNPLLNSPTRGDSCTSLGAFSGLTIGSWLNYRYLNSETISRTTYSMQNSNNKYDGQIAALLLSGTAIKEPVNIIMIQCTRWFIGIFVVLVGREILNELTYKFLCRCHSINPEDKLTKYDKRIEIPLKLIVYTYVGAALSCFSPLIMSVFNV